ncbi:MULTISPECIES: hypothetical protein [Helcococcus]|uniref:Uncharacterized protein n=1 Tax=Helcococcus bovis TaxID=3153252 RepID=A0ABW9F5M7_9FIRM
MKILKSTLKSILSLILNHPILIIFSVFFLILISSFINWKYGRTYYELKPTSPEGIKVVSITKEIFYPNFESELFLKYPDKKELVKTNIKLGGKYKGIVEDDSGYTLTWNNNKTATLTWDNIMFGGILEEIIRY